MIQIVPFIPHQKKQNGQNGLKHFLHLIIWLYMLRVIVFFIPSISTLVRFGFEEIIST